MSSRRTAKVAEAIREIVSTTVLFHLKDPRVRNVTVLRADVSPDLKYAKIYVSIMGDEKEQALCMHGLHSARDTRDRVDRGSLDRAVKFYEAAVQEFDHERPAVAATP